MIRWKYLFSQRLIDQGRSLRDRGCVRKREQNGSRFFYDVEDGETFTVSAQIEGNLVRDIRCNCTRARDNGYCAHMAAMLWTLEREREPKKTAKNGQADPFADMVPAQDGEYRYFDIQHITRRLVFKSDVCKKARQLIQKGAVGQFELNTGFLGYDEKSGLVLHASCVFTTDSYGEGAHAYLSRDGLISSSCDVYCNGYDYNGMRYTSIRPEPNEYITALLMLVAQALQTSNVGDSTDIRAQRLLDGFFGASVPEGDGGGDVSLEPRLTREDDALYLSLRVGKGKMYVVRNIPAFVDCVEKKETYSSGRLKLDFSADRIRDDDAALYRFVKGVLRDVACLTDNLSGSSFYGRPPAYAENVKQSLELYGSRLDRFYDLFSGREGVDFTDRQTEKAPERLRMGSGLPDVSIRLDKDVDEYGVFHGILATGTAPPVLEGADSIYFIGGDTLCRIPQEAQQRLKPIFDLLDGDETFSFRVGRGHLSEFYYSVLPVLRELADVSEADDAVVKQYLPPEVAFVFYLDAVEDALLCRTEAVYGEQRFPAADSDGQTGGHFRDYRRETAAMKTVKCWFPDKREEALYACQRDNDRVYDLMTEGVPALMKLGEVQATDAFRKLKVRSRLHVQVGVSVESHIMELEITSDVSPEELLEILKSYKQKKRFHRLKNGDLVSFDETVEELSDMVDALHLSAADLRSGKMSLPAYRALYLEQMTEKCESLRISRDRYSKRIAQSFKTVSESDYEVPASLRDVLRPYQAYGHRWLRTLAQYGFGGILADDMGLGKTLQVISVLLAAKEEGETLPALVVCPASLVYNWLEELSRFAPTLSCVAIAGNQRERQALIGQLDGHDVVVTSYDLIKRDIMLYEEKEFSCQIIDEAQYIKTHTTAAAKAVKVIRSRVRFALTGTPIENRLSELWSIFDYLMPDFLYGYDTFRKEFETPIARKGDAAATERLKRMVSPFILRRLKGDVLRDLPDKIEEVRYAAFEEKQQLLYDAQATRMLKKLEEADEESIRRSKIEILSELTRLREICCDPSLLFEDYKGGSAKRTACLDLVQSAIEGEHRILLFSQFTSMLALLEEDLQKAGIRYYRLDGSTPKAERVELVRKFNTGDVPLFLISLKAGGTGLNLTGADVVIHYDPWWNVAAQNQATDRAHRIGQTRVVSVYRLIARRTVEEKILQLQESKKNLADAILSGEMGSLGSLTRDELLALLQ